MPNVLHATWKTNRHWLAAGFLIATALFLLLMYINVRSSFGGIAESKQTGLAAIAGSPASFFFPELRSWAMQERSYPRFIETRYSEDQTEAAETKRAAPDRLVIRTATMRVVAADPVSVAAQAGDLAKGMSGFVVSSTVKGDQTSRAADVVVRIPAAHFDEARAQIRQMARWVEEDSVQARDVTREAIDQDATLRNARAEEAQYLDILKRASTVKDVMAVSEKLAGVRGSIERQTAELRYLRQQVELSQISISIAAVPPDDKPGVHWRPIMAARLSAISAAESMGEFVDAVLSLILHVPVIIAWMLLVFVILRVGWWVLVRLSHVFLPDIPWWRRRAERPQG